MWNWSAGHSFSCSGSVPREHIGRMLFIVKSSQVYFGTDDQPVRLGVGNLSFCQDNCFNPSNGTPTLTRRRVCNFQCILILVGVTQNSWPQFTVSFETFPTWRVSSPYLYPPGTGWPSYTPEHWVTFCRLLRIAGLRWGYSNPPPHWLCIVIIAVRFCWSLLILIMAAVSRHARPARSCNGVVTRPLRFYGGPGLSDQPLT
jgi:hypothetical protein